MLWLGSKVLLFLMLATEVGKKWYLIVNLVVLFLAHKHLKILCLQVWDRMLKFLLMSDSVQVLMVSQKSCIIDIMVSDSVSEHII